jgi:hypothetical protein
MTVRLSAPRAGHLLLPGRFLVLISVRAWVDPQGHIAAWRIRSIEESNDFIGNRTRDLPACSIMPQPTTLPRALMALWRYYPGICPGSTEENHEQIPDQGSRRPGPTSRPPRQKAGSVMVVLRDAASNGASRRVTRHSWNRRRFHSASLSYWRT